LHCGRIKGREIRVDPCSSAANTCARLSKTSPKIISGG
jgi:hypothetical protein